MELINLFLFARYPVIQGIYCLVHTNFQRAYSAGVMSLDIIELMTFRIISAAIFSSEKSRPQCKGATA